MLKHFVIITPEAVKLNGNDMAHVDQGNALLTELYRTQDGHLEQAGFCGFRDAVER